jgi:AcrR family transcriptional regulator
VSGRSTVSRLPAAVRALIGRLRQDGHTIDEITAKLHELDVQVSRSSLARHTRSLDAIGEQIRRSRWIGEALVARLGDAPESRQARVNLELMQSLIMQLLAGEDGEPVQLTPQDAMLLCRAIADLARAHKADVERELAIRREFAHQAAAKIEEAGRDPALRAEGMTPELAARFRHLILGLAPPPAATPQQVFAHAPRPSPSKTSADAAA